MIRKLLILIIFLAFPTFTFAAELVHDIFPVTVNGFVNVDNTSTVDVNPNINEVGIDSDVVVRVLDRNSNPISGREIELYVVGNPAEITITQPAANSDSDGYVIGKVRSSVQGTYTVRARDVSFPTDIDIADTDSFTTFPITAPSFYAEPYYTKGTSNRVYWGLVSGLSSYSYYVEISKKSDFSTVLANSGWITTNSYEFTNLSNGQIYYYRVKAKNVGNIESSWSSVVFSTQDNQAPVIKYVDIARITSGKSFSGISVKFDVTDNFEVDTVEFFCKRSDGSLEACGTIESSGARYYVNVPTSDLEKGAFGTYLDSYTFCVTATDKAGNSTQNCDFKIDVADYIQTPVPIFTNLINSIIEYINDNLRDISKLISSSLIASNEFVLQLLIIILYIIIIVVSLAILAQGVFVIPSFLLYQLFRTLKYFGFKKHNTQIGVVYNSINGRPVKFANVKIYDGKNILVHSDITDKNGMFYGDIDTGKYRVHLTRSHFLFPSELYKEQGTPKNGKLYRGEYFIFSPKNPLNLSIPIDPINIYSEAEKNVQLQNRMFGVLKSFAFLFIAIGLAVSAYTFERFPNAINLVLLLMYIPAVGVFLKSVIKLKLF